MANVETRAKLKVGVLLESRTVPAWVHKTLSEIDRTDFLELSLLVLCQASSQKPWIIHRWWRVLSTLLFHLYERMDYSLHQSEHDALAEMGLPDRSVHTAVIEVAGEHTDSGFGFGPQDVRRVQSKKLDVILCANSNGGARDLVGAAKYGVWDYRLGDATKYPDWPPLFGEMYDQNPVSELLLHMMTEKGNGSRILYRSSSSTNPNSICRNRNALHWKLSHAVLGALRNLYQHGGKFIHSLPMTEEIPPSDRQRRRHPGNLAMIRLLAPLARRYLYDKVRSKLCSRKWHIGWRPRRKFDAQHLDVSGFQPIPAPPDRYYADPFLLEHEGATYAFFEEADCLTSKRSIACCELAAGGIRTLPKTVLQREYSMSYPFVFRYQSGVYMIPETSSNRTVELYVARRFPEQWELQKIIFEDITAVDTTLLEYRGKWWLFTAVARSGADAKEELLLFFADSPLGAWKPHPQNPIITDVRRARPGGKIFDEGGQLIRPAQDCSRGYGYALSFNLIEMLNEREYKEVELGRVEPGRPRYATGPHTWNRSTDFEVLDWETYSWNWNA